MHSKKIRAYLDSVAGIAALLPQAERLIELRRIFAKLAPQQLLRSSSIVNYKQGKVVIFAENSAVAAKLKLLSPQLVDGFTNQGVEATGIRVEVQPLESPQPVPRTKQARLTAGGADHLRTLAERLPDSSLKQAVTYMALRQAADDVPGTPREGSQYPEQPKKRK